MRCKGGLNLQDLKLRIVKWASNPQDSLGDTPTPWVCHGTSNTIEAKNKNKNPSKGVWPFSLNRMLLFIKNGAKKLDDCSICSLKFFYTFKLVFVSRRWKRDSIDKQKNKHHQF